MATLWDWASGRTDARNAGAMKDGRMMTANGGLASGRTDARSAGAMKDGRMMTANGGDLPWYQWEMNKPSQNILNQRAADQNAFNATAPKGYGNFSWNGPISDQDKQWYYNLQQTGAPWNGALWGNSEDWRGITNDVGNSDLLAGATQMARDGGLGNYHSAFSDALRGYIGQNPLDSYGTYNDATKGWLKDQMTRFGITPTGSAADALSTPGTPATATNTTSTTSATTPETSWNATTTDTIPDFGDPITDPSAYLNPYVDWSNKQAMDKIQQSAAARGNLNSGATIKALSDYLTGSNQQNWNNAETTALADAARRYGIYNNDRNFDYTANVDDRNFNYNASVNDRNFNNSNLQYLANLGLSGTQGQAQLQQLLATLLSNNTIAAGQASGAGTIGSSNAVSNALQQIITQMLLGQYYPRG